VGEHTIVVIEDEPAIADAVAARLRADGFAVETAGDGPSGVELVRRAAPSLVVLDVMLPGFDGHEVCRRIQADRPVPVIMLTARDAETDMLVGLGIGADDYMTKPFSVRELSARVKAIIRRVERVEAAADPAVPPPIVAGDLEIDPAARRARLKGSELPLTATEFELLHHLARSPGIVFNRDRLLSEVWGYPDGVGPRTVDSHVAGLRRKLGPGWLRTSRGVGYAFDPEPA
jgi:DNA-binding response OmpR family regulator